MATADIQAAVISGATRIVYDQTCSDLLSNMDQVLHELVDAASPGSDFRSGLEALHTALHALSGRLVDNEIAAVEIAAREDWRPINTWPHDGSIIEVQSHRIIKWCPYAKAHRERTGHIGRWKALNEYGGWDATRPPNDVWRPARSGHDVRASS